MQEAPLFGFVVCMHHALCKKYEQIWYHVTFFKYICEWKLNWVVLFFKFQNIQFIDKIPQVVRVK